MGMGQNYVPKMEPCQMEPRTKTCGPGRLILTHTQMTTGPLGILPEEYKLGI